MSNCDIFKCHILEFLLQYMRTRENPFTLQSGRQACFLIIFHCSRINYKRQFFFCQHSSSSYSYVSRQLKQEEIEQHLELQLYLVSANVATLKLFFLKGKNDMHLNYKAYYQIPIYYARTIFVSVLSYIRKTFQAFLYVSSSICNYVLF